MSTEVVSTHLYRKRTIKNLKGEIIDLLDEADGGHIIRKGQIVNQEKYNELLRKEEDRKLAARAIEEAVVRTEDNSVHPSKIESKPDKVQELEKKVDDINSKLEAILNAINKNQ